MSELNELADRLHSYSLRMRYYGRESEADDMVAAESGLREIAKLSEGVRTALTLFDTFFGGQHE